MLFNPVFANEDIGETTNIKEDVTPESPRKEINNYSMLYLLSFAALAIGVYVIREQTKRNELVLNIDSIESNNDGSYIVSFGYKNPDNTISFKEGDCGIRVVKGKAIILKKPNTNDFETGSHKDTFIAVINEDSVIEYYVGSQKISINGKEIKEKEDVDKHA